MKLTIERSALLRALGHVQNVVERRNTIPILSNVQLVADEAGLNLTATDLDLAIVETVPAEVQTAGGTTAPAHILHDIVRKLPDGAQVELDYGADDGHYLERVRQAVLLDALFAEAVETARDDSGTARRRGRTDDTATGVELQHRERSGHRGLDRSP
ncbi:MAG: hypothetical protein CMM23_04665, partial [Rhodospirillaceae bacterium]|nr:hypothetical protein [Rhodospirillaceae bacterium]